MNSGKTQAMSHCPVGLANNHKPNIPPHSNKGFTLVELLVVMIIVSAITTLLVSGLSTTWDNFSKLNSSKLTIVSSKLPLLWFSNSVNGALLYHPKKSYFTGTRQSFTYITSLAPDTPKGVPTEVTWSLDNNQLVYLNNEKNDAVNVLTSNSKLYFEYLENNEWVQDVSNKEGQLPEAIRIIDENNHILVMASPQRPTTADIPDDIRLDGELQF